jgi:hypothetical protein
LKKLVDLERIEYNQDRARFEDDCLQISRHAEAKLKIIKNKLITLYDGNLEMARDLSLDEIIDHVAFRLTSLVN